MRIIDARAWAAIVGAAMTVAGCVAPSSAPPVQVQRPPVRTAPVVVAPAPIPARIADLALVRPPATLTARIDQLWRDFPGKTGIAVRRIDGEWSYAKRGDELFPQQSVSKLWVAMTVLDQIDAGRLSLATPVEIGPEHLTLFNQPIAARVARQGRVTETVAGLIEQAITKSDNTANDSLLRVAGGPDAVRAFIAAKGLRAVRFGPGERLLQSSIAGMSWNQAFSQGNRFYVERAKVPEFIRRKALDSYVADPIDGASPQAIVDALARLARQELLSPQSTRLLLDTMARTTSGPQRLKGGVPAGWQFGHKTGTGQQLGATSTGYNDIGILTAPDGTRYAIAVMIGSTTVGIPERMAMMQAVTRAVAEAHGR